MAVKFNDHFEFPLVLDMAPYSLAGARGDTTPLLYRLVGVVVHSGQASGGHYYSFCVKRQSESARAEKDPARPSASDWLKFDDTEVCRYSRILQAVFDCA